MVRMCFEQRSVLEVLLPDGEKLWPEDLALIDQLLEQDDLVETVSEALGNRWPESGRRGRPGTPADVVLRMLALKHLYSFSYDELEYAVRANLAYRAFCHVGLEKVPDAKTILKIAHTLGPQTIQKLNDRVVQLARAAGVSKGKRLRIDTTVVETNVRYPIDSDLLADGIRLITRAAKRVEELIGAGVKRFRDSVRNVIRLATSMKMIKPSPERKKKLAEGYRKLVEIAKRVLRDGERAIDRVAERLRQAADPAPVRRRLEKLHQSLRDTSSLLSRVIKQTVERVFGGNTHVKGKVLSFFEPHTEAIRKGKILKPTEFGKLVSIQEAEGGLITAYEVEDRVTADANLWQPAIEKHIEVFGRAPYLAAADRGFYSESNESVAIEMGVKRVCLPKPGGLSIVRRDYQRQGWFREGLRWRVGSEGRISVLKRRHGLRRSLYRGDDGMKRWVGLGVIASNLLAMARHFLKGRRQSDS